MPIYNSGKIRPATSDMSIVYVEYFITKCTEADMKKLPRYISGE